jgi:hypothetical protein
VDLAAVSTWPASRLHQFRWLDDAAIGALPYEWNWLEGHYRADAGATPRAVHFTRGGPWFEQWQDVEFADLWWRERNDLVRR